MVHMSPHCSEYSLLSLLHHLSLVVWLYDSSESVCHQCFGLKKRLATRTAKKKQTHTFCSSTQENAGFSLARFEGEKERKNKLDDHPIQLSQAISIFSHCFCGHFSIITVFARRGRRRRRRRPYPKQPKSLHVQFVCVCLFPINQVQSTITWQRKSSMVCAKVCYSIQTLCSTPLPPPPRTTQSTD